MTQELLLKEALSLYGLASAETTFLRHNENLVFKVIDKESKAYVLRIHMPANGVNGAALMQQAKWIEGELGFLALLHDKSKIKVQRPKKTTAGNLVGMVQGIPVTLLLWIEGGSFDTAHPDATALAASVGKMAAQMHSFVMNAPQAACLNRPRYDGAHIKSACDAIRGGVALGLFSDSAYTTLAKCAEAIASLLDDAFVQHGKCGLIHADLGLGNIIVSGAQVSPIDFSLCGFAPFLFDLGGLMGTFDNPVHRKAVLDGYNAIRPLSPDDFRMIEATFIMSIMLFMSMHLRNENVQAWFHRRLPHVIADYVKPFNEGDSFLHTLR